MNYNKNNKLDANISFQEEKVSFDSWNIFSHLTLAADEFIYFMREACTYDVPLRRNNITHAHQG